MGHGIAQVAATAGYDVTIRDIDESILEDGLSSIESNLQGGVDRDKLTSEEMDAALNRIETTTSLVDAVTDAEFIVEAVPEDMELKRSTFEDIAAKGPEDAILATNTSSLSVTEIASVLDRPGRAIGLHFFNPVHIMGLVEIVVAEQTDEMAVEATTKFVEALVTEPVTVRDSAGFASSRLGVTLGVEAIRMLEEGVAGPRDIDTAMELGYNHPMGPIELGDVVGLDVRLDILEYLREELTNVLTAIKDDDAVRVLVLTGAEEGGAFVAGADVTELRERDAIEQREASKRPRVYERVADLPKPVIGRINGHALGGGCELAQACDVRIAAESARLGQPEINLGIIPGGGGTQRLPHLVGEGQAMRLILSGELIDAAEAADIGLVDEVYPADELDERVYDLAASMAEKSPVALEFVKTTIQASTKMDLEDGIEYEAELFAQLFATEDKNEGIDAFLEDRDPEWQGR